MSNFTVYDGNGYILSSGIAPASMVSMQAKLGEFVIEASVDIDKNYILNGDIKSYTEAELQAKNNLPRGWSWKMPERIAIDPRTTVQRSIDAAKAVQESRSAAYPPLVDLADALYWQAQGDGSKMTNYLAACDAVKRAHPKSN